MKRVRRNSLDGLRLKIRDELKQRALPPAIRATGGSLIDAETLKECLFPAGKYVPQKNGPKPALPVDNFIRELSRSHKLSPLKGDDSDHAVPCPFLIARTYVYRAYEAADVEEGLGEWLRNELRLVLKFSCDTKTELETLLVRREESANARWVSSRATKDLRELIASVQAEISDFERRLSKQPSGKGDVWKIRFARTLGYGWADLAGDPPAWTAAGKKGNLFLDFVKAAFETVGGRESEKWDRACRTAIEQERKLPTAEQWNYKRLIRERPLLTVRAPSDLDANKTISP